LAGYVAGVMRLGSAVRLAVLVFALSGVAPAWALQPLPPGGQVNADPAAGIDPSLNVSAEEPASADVTGGALTAGARAVPWAIFRQQESGGAHDQVFVRSFAGGAWTTRGNGTVGSSGKPQSFSGSLNFDPTQDAEAPAIDFAGSGRSVPWATWYENTSGVGFGANNIFASRFDVIQGKWVFAGQARSAGAPSVPSLNIHTGKDAENPSVAGGSTTFDTTKPVPWVTWQEQDGASNRDQIFVERAEGGMTDCTGVRPTGVTNGGVIPALGGFCWQQVGIERFNATDPSLNVDPTRFGNEPDIAFTGPGDNVPWVVWYESGDSGIGLNGTTTDMVFAAKAVADGAADGGFHWVAVGSAAQGELDTSGTAPHNIGSCGASTPAENACSLDTSASGSAEDPRVAAGTMTPGGVTVPWVAWDENDGSGSQIFVARLVGIGAAATFQIANNGSPISATTGPGNSTRPDITFSGNTPYVTWRKDVGGGVEQAFAGHFVNAATPTFVVDSTSTPITPHTTTDVREPVSSSCTANPFDQDGAACPGGALGTPFFLFTNGPVAGPHSLFADAYSPDAPVAEADSAVTASSATVGATVDPHGASADVEFEYGTTTAYGQTTPLQPTGPVNGATPFSAALTGLPAGTLIHFRADAINDFGTVAGADQTFTTASAVGPPPGGGPGSGDGTATLGHVTVSGTTATTKVACAGASTATCKLKLELEVTETLRGHKVIAVAAAKHHKPKVTHKVVIVGTRSVTLGASKSATEHVALNATGKRLLSTHHTLKCKLLVIATLGNGHHRTIKTTIVTFHAPKPKKHKHHR
jgi:hypothetical protein